MRNNLAELINEMDYDDKEKVEVYHKYRPHKMTKQEFVREMLRLQEEKHLYGDWNTRIRFE